MQQRTIEHISKDKPVYSKVSDALYRQPYAWKQDKESAEKELQEHYVKENQFK